MVFRTPMNLRPGDFDFDPSKLDQANVSVWRKGSLSPGVGLFPLPHQSFHNKDLKYILQSQVFWGISYGNGSTLVLFNAIFSPYAHLGKLRTSFKKFQNFYNQQKY